MGGCQNCGPFLGTLNIGGRIILGIQKGTIILTTSHMVKGLELRVPPVKPLTWNLAHNSKWFVLVGLSNCDEA